MRYVTKFVHGTRLIEINEEAPPNVSDGAVWIHDGAQYVILKKVQRCDGIFDDQGTGSVERLIGFGKNPTDLRTTTVFNVRPRPQGQIDDELRGKKNAETARQSFQPLSPRARRARDIAEFIEISEDESVVVLRRRPPAYTGRPDSPSVLNLSDSEVASRLRDLADRLDKGAVK
jgi:hypothetical protein